MPTPTLSSVFTNIANAIRSKNGLSTTYTPTQMPQAILDISSGSEATITVTYDSEYYNKTITCTKGSTTLSDTTTSSGSTVFTVDEEGTWTITCNGISKTVDVVLDYTTQMTITKTVTVYSAASDTVSFTDATGAKTVTTNTSGQGSVSISFIPNSTITFTSSYAKNPNNLSQAYSKTITMTDNISSVYVMPDKVLYWYGNQVNIKAVNEGGVLTFVAPTWNTRDATVTLSGQRKYCNFRPNTAVTATKAYCIATTPLGGNSNAYLYIDSTYSAFTSSNSPAYLAHTNTNGGEPFLALGNGSIETGTYTETLYALWYE